MNRSIIAIALGLVGLAAGSVAHPQTTSVEGLVVTQGEAPPPVVGQGAPNYSPEQTASIVCETPRRERWAAFRTADPLVRPASLNEVQRRATRLHEATLRARDVRKRAFVGQASSAEMERAELDRQAALRGLAPVSPVRSDIPEGLYQGLLIESLSSARVVENGRAVLVVSGRIRNTTSASRELPPLTLSALDHRGFVLAAQTDPLTKVSIAASEVQLFTARFKNPPRYMTEVKAHFGEPFGVRNFRGCEFLNPLTFDAQRARLDSRPAGARPLPIPKVGEGAPDYSPDELAAMVSQARADARAAFSQGPVLTIPILARTASIVAPPKECALEQSWRSLMILADKIEEAWIATTAAEEVRRDAARGVFLPQEVADAELARQAAVRAFIAARPAPLAAKVQAAQPVVTALRRSGREFTLVRGQVRNAGEAPVEVPPLLVTVADRHGFVLTQWVLYSKASLRPGRSQAFSVTTALPSSLVADVNVSVACLPETPSAS